MPPRREQELGLPDKTAREIYQWVRMFFPVPHFENGILIADAIERLWDHKLHFIRRPGNHLELARLTPDDRVAQFINYPSGLEWEDGKPRTMTEAITFQMKVDMNRVNFTNPIKRAEGEIAKRPHSRRAEVLKKDARERIVARHIALAFRDWSRNPQSQFQQISTTLINESVSWQSDRLLVTEGQLYENIVDNLSKFDPDNFIKNLSATLFTDLFLGLLSVSTPSMWPLTLARAVAKPVHKFLRKRSGEHPVYGIPPEGGQPRWFFISEDSTNYVNAYKAFAEYYNSLPANSNMKITDPQDRSKVLDTLPSDDKSMELVALSLFLSMKGPAFTRINTLAGQMHYANATIIEGLQNIKKVNY